jgi:hypothetical protein
LDLGLLDRHASHRDHGRNFYGQIDFLRVPARDRFPTPRFFDGDQAAHQLIDLAPGTANSILKQAGLK